MEILKIEEHLDNWDLTVDDLIEKYGFYEIARQPGNVWICAHNRDKPTRLVLFGDFKCYVSFHYYDFAYGDKKPYELVVCGILPDKSVLDGVTDSDLKYQEVYTDYHKSILESIYGDPSNIWNRDERDYGYSWKLNNCTILTYVGYDIHMTPTGGKIYIHFDK